MTSAKEGISEGSSSDEDEESLRELVSRKPFHFGVAFSSFSDLVLVSGTSHCDF